MKRFELLCAELTDLHPSIQLKHDEPMSGHTSFRIGGPAALMVLPKNKGEARDAIRLARRFELPLYILGGGSNLLFSDERIPGVVIKTHGALSAIQIEQEGGIRAECGALLPRLSSFALVHSLSGLEFAQGIPGTLGGAIVMNAGAYGGEISNLVIETVCLDRDGTETIFSGPEHHFSYRHSVFSDSDYFILESRLSLKPGARDEIAEKMKLFQERRRESQPLDFPNAGSVFKRPEGYFAAALIDECGLKGARIGGAQVSLKHAGFIVNLGGATCREVLALVESVREEVLQKTGVLLELEFKRIP